MILILYGKIPTPCCKPIDLRAWTQARIEHLAGTAGNEGGDGEMIGGVGKNFHNVLLVRHILYQIARRDTKRLSNTR